MARVRCSRGGKLLDWATARQWLNNEAPPPRLATIPALPDTPLAENHVGPRLERQTCRRPRRPWPCPRFPARVASNQAGWRPSGTACLSVVRNVPSVLHLRRSQLPKIAVPPRPPKQQSKIDRAS